MYDPTERRPLNIIGLLILFVVFTAAGTVLAYVYLGAIDFIAYIYPNVLIAAGYGVVMFFLVFATKKMFKITNNAGAIIVIILGIVIINYFKWQIYFGVWYTRFTGQDLSFIEIRYVLDALRQMILYPFEHNINPVTEFFRDLRFFNSMGTWTFGEDANAVTGIWLGLIWSAEFIIMFGASIIAAATTVGILLPGYGKLASPKYLLYNFVPFTGEQTDSLAAYKDINVILSQPLAGANSVLSTDKDGIVSVVRDFDDDTGVIAHLHVNDQPTEYILISKINAKSWTQGDLAGKWSAPIPLGMEAIENLKEELAKLHDVPEVEDDADAAGDEALTVDSEAATVDGEASTVDEENAPDDAPEAAEHVDVETVPAADSE